MAIDLNELTNVGVGLANSAVNIGFGAAAMAAEKSKEFISSLDEKGANVRGNAQTPDIAKSVSDMFEQAGGTISDLTARLSDSSETVAVRVLDELILAHVRGLDAAEKTAFVAHVTDLVASAEKKATQVDVESVEENVEDAVDAVKDKVEDVVDDIKDAVEG